MKVENKPHSPIAKLFAKPAVGIFGTVASIFSLIAAIYFYHQSRIFPELTFLVNPAITTVVNTNQTSRLNVLHDNKEIKTNVKATQVAIWNRGRKSIKTNDILKPIFLELKPGAQILESSVVITSRDLIGLLIDQSQATDGKLGLSWKILEENDGATIQIIYASNEDQNISVVGVIEGQRKIKSRKLNPQAIESIHPLGNILGEKYAAWAGLAISLIFGTFAYFVFRGGINSNLLIGRRIILVDIIFNRWLILGLALVYFIISAYVLLFWHKGMLPITF